MSRTLQIRLKDDLEQRVLETSAAAGLTPSAWARGVLEEMAQTVEIPPEEALVDPGLLPAVAERKPAPPKEEPFTVDQKTRIKDLVKGGQSEYAAERLVRRSS